jgi:hypothetical protein
VPLESALSDLQFREHLFQIVRILFYSILAGPNEVPSRRWLELGWRSLRVVQPK